MSWEVVRVSIHDQFKVMDVFEKRLMALAAITGESFPLGFAVFSGHNDPRDPQTVLFYLSPEASEVGRVIPDALMRREGQAAELPDGYGLLIGNWAEKNPFVRAALDTLSGRHRG